MPSNLSILARTLYFGPDLEYDTLNRHPFGYDAFNIAAILEASNSAEPFFALVSISGLLLPVEHAPLQVLELQDQQFQRNEHSERQQQDTDGADRILRPDESAP